MWVRGGLCLPPAGNLTPSRSCTAWQEQEGPCAATGSRCGGLYVLNCPGETGHLWLLIIYVCGEQFCSMIVHVSMLRAHLGLPRIAPHLQVKGKGGEYACDITNTVSHHPYAKVSAL